jgi:preprotein translocase subunit YajC
MHILIPLAAIVLLIAVFVAVKRQEKQRRKQNSERLMRHVNREYSEEGVQ